MRWIPVAVILGLFLAGGPEAATPIAKVDRSNVEFEADILPILRANCLPCHNRNTAKAGLNLESPAAMLKGGDSGPAITPRRGDKSLLLQAASHAVEPRMPPKANKANAVDLTPEELGLIKLWINKGAKAGPEQNRPVEWKPMPSTFKAIAAVALSGDGQFAACARANVLAVHRVPSQETFVCSDPRGVATHDVISATAFSPDGKLLASGGYREVKLWARTSARLSAVPEVRGPVNPLHVALSPDGLWVAEADGRTVRIASRTAPGGRSELKGHPAAVEGLEFSPAADRLLSWDASGQLRVWGFVSNQLAAELTLPAVLSCGWVSDDVLIALQRGEGLKILTMPTTNHSGSMGLKRSLPLDAGYTAKLVAVAPGASVCVVAMTDGGTLDVRDLTEGKLLKRLDHGSVVSAVHLAAGGRRAVSIGTDGSAKLWDVKAGVLVSSLQGAKSDSDARFELDESLQLAKADVAYFTSSSQVSFTNQTRAGERVAKATEDSEKAVKAVEEKAAALAKLREVLSEAEKVLEAHTEVRRVVEGFEAAEVAFKKAEADLKAVRERKDTAAESAAAMTLEKRREEREMAKTSLEAVQSERRAAFTKARESVNTARKPIEEAEKQLQTAERVRGTAEHETELARKSKRTADESLETAQTRLTAAGVLTTNLTERLKAVDIAAGSASNVVRAANFGLEGRVVVTGEADGAIRVWDALDGAPLDTLQGARRGVTRVLTGGSHVFVLDESRRLRSVVISPGWSFLTAMGDGSPKSPMSDRISALAFSPDGRWLATGGGQPTRGGEIHVWDVQRRRIVHSFTNVHSDQVFALAWSPDGRFLASGGADRFARIVEVATGKVVKAFEGHTHHVLGVAWRRDGRWIASAGADGVVKVWDVDTGARLLNITGHDKEVTAVGFLGITGQMVAVSGDPKVRLIKEDGGELKVLDGGREFLAAGSVDRRGQHIAAGGPDGVLRVWKTTNAAPVMIVHPPAANGKRP